MEEPTQRVSQCWGIVQSLMLLTTRESPHQWQLAPPPNRLVTTRDSYARRWYSTTANRRSLPLNQNSYIQLQPAKLHGWYTLDYDRMGVAIHKSEGERRSLSEPLTDDFINYYPYLSTPHVLFHLRYTLRIYPPLAPPTSFSRSQATFLQP